MADAPTVPGLFDMGVTGGAWASRGRPDNRIASTEPDGFGGRRHGGANRSRLSGEPLEMEILERRGERIGCPRTHQGSIHHRA